MITYQCSLTFWTAAFPGLARDLPEVQESAENAKDGQKTRVHLFDSFTFIYSHCLHRLEKHADFESLARNRVSNVSFAVSSVGEIVILAIMVGILKAVKSDESTANNTKAFSILIAFSGGVWRSSALIYRPTRCLIIHWTSVLCAIPWFLLEQRRPGLKLPPGASLLTIGFKQTYVALRECMRLKQTFLYLIFYFLM